MLLLKAYWALLCSRLRKTGTWLLLLLLPMTVWALKSYIPGSELSAPVQVGVALPKQGAEEFRLALEERSGTVINFVFTDEEKLNGMVAAGLWDCGIVLPEDFERRMEDMDTDGIISLRTSQSSKAYPLVKETVSACLLRMLSPAIAADYMESAGIGQGSDFEAVLPEEQSVLVSMRTINGSELQIPELAENGFDSMVQGAIFILFALWAMFAAADMCRWTESPAGKRASALQKRTSLLLPRAAAALTPLFVSGGISLLLLKEPLWALAALLPLGLLTCALVLLLSRWKSLASALPLLSPFVPVVCILTSPAVYSHGGALPMTLFLEGCGGSVTALLLLWLWVSVVALLLLGIENSRLTRIKGATICKAND